ncbi:hypothetical protein V1517DRAFT_260024 [Lipomyces orientalis]|uniref:Uncharacterized protein n=1 Tax=Lipomyces orientalis TaxID=1233043 RepID=A0ACC3TN50_9ASCO
MTTVTPPSLSYFCIFNPSYCYNDETLHDQIFFYTSRAESVSADEQLRKVGLIQGIISFASDFSNRKPVEIIDTRKTRTVIVEIEPNWWLVACINFTRIQTPVQANSPVSSSASSMTNSKTNGTKIGQNGGDNGGRGGALASFRRRKKMEIRTDYSRKEVPSCSVMHSQIIRGYSQWKLLYGHFPPSRVCDDGVTPKDEDADADYSVNEKREPAADDAMHQFRLNLRKFWSWWLHKWELYMFSTATWGGTLNNSFLANNLVLGSAPTLSFSFMDYASGIRMCGGGRISDLTSEAIKAIVKREARNGMVDLIITRLNSFSIVAPGGSLVRSGGAGDTASISSGVEKAMGDADSIYSTKDDGASIRSSRSRRSRFFEKESIASEPGSDSEDYGCFAADEDTYDEELRNGCVFQGAGYMSRTSVGEYSRWIIDNHIFPSPTAVEGVKWSLFANKEDPTIPFAALVFSFKYGFKRPMPPPPPKKQKNKKTRPPSIITNSATDSAARSSGVNGSASKNLTSYSKLAMEQVRDSSLALIHRVTSGSTVATSNTTGTDKKKQQQQRELKDDLSDGKFMVGFQGELESDMFDDENEADDEDVDANGQKLEVSFREVYIQRKKKKNKDKMASVVQQAQEQEADKSSDTIVPSSSTAANTAKPESSVNGTDHPNGSATTSVLNSAATQKLERLYVVIYKRAPFIFSAFFDPATGESSLSDPDYYRALHLRLGSLAEPIFEDLENAATT